MTIPQPERDRMLQVALCGPRVLLRLEAIGIRGLDELADRDPYELVLAVNHSAGHPIWRPPMATRAMSNLIDAARAARRDRAGRASEASGRLRRSA
jgi:hypothetical protein